MPDWSYRTIFRPVLLRLPLPLARDLCLGFMGGLARLPLGSAVIDFLGHMRPDARLRTEVAGLSLTSPIILGPLLDCRLLATEALSRFGVGMVEVGLVTTKTNSGSLSRRDEAESFAVSDPLPSVALDDVMHRLPAAMRVPLLVRLGNEPAAGDGKATQAEVVRQLRERAAAFAVDLDTNVLNQSSIVQWREQVQELAGALGGISNRNDAARPLFVCVPADFDLDNGLPYVKASFDVGISGIIVDGRVRDSAYGWLVGRAAGDASLRSVKRLREEIGPRVSIVGGGVNQPEAALALLAAGANAVQVDVALAYSGPGLPKRINDAILFARCSSSTTSVNATEHHAALMSWFWALLLGVSMVLGGLLAMAFAITRVVLPYDEAYLGMSAEELSSRVPRLLSFMAHDRVTLAGTMLAVGIQYVFLSWYGIRRGLHWAKVTVVASAFTGFVSFFLFLGFGYFDPLHAFVTAILFQFLLLAFQGHLGPGEPPEFPNLASDWRWQMANWGQMLLVIQGAAIITAGVTISTVGITTVFVPEDLEFMGTSVDALWAANPRLVPVVAHDRASFGGMLISVGVATLFPALWGIQQGVRWLWWMLALAGTIAYCATLCVHLHVGYTDPHHLAPAFGGLALLWIALALLYPYLVADNLGHKAAWEELQALGNRL